MKLESAQFRLTTRHHIHTHDTIMTRTVQSDAGLRLVVFARHLPDVEGLGGRVGQKAEHQDDGVGVGKTVGVDLSVRETKRGHVLLESGLTQRSVGIKRSGSFSGLPEGVTPHKNLRRRSEAVRGERDQSILTGKSEEERK